MPSWLMVAAISAGLAQAKNLTKYNVPSSQYSVRTAEAEAQFMCRDTYTLKELFVLVIANTITNGSTVRSRVNIQGGGNQNGAQSVSIPASTTGTFQDTANSDSLSDGDLFASQIVTPNAGTSITITIISYILQTASNNSPIIGCNPVKSISSGATYFQPIAGERGDAEARTQYTFRVAATLSNFRIVVGANTFTTNGSTARVRIGGQNGNQVISIPAGTTGALEDTTNTDAIAVGQLVNYTLVAGTQAGKSLQLSSASIKSAATGRQTACASGGTATLAYGQTVYLTLEGHSQSFATTEANVQCLTRLAFVAKNFFVNVPTNSVNNGSTFRTRKNGNTNGNLTVSVPASTTGVFEDTTNSDSILVTDSYNYQVITGGTSGTMQICAVGFELQQVAEGETYVETGKEQVILAAQAEADIAIRLDTGKTEVVLTAQGIADLATLLDIAKLQVILVEQGATDSYIPAGGAEYDETGKLQVILVAQAETDSTILSDTAKLEIILAAQGLSDAQIMQELAKLEVILAAQGKTDVLTLPELSKEQVILSVSGREDKAILSDTTKLQVILGLQGATDNAIFNELALLQVILAAQGATDIYIPAGIVYDETGKLELIIILQAISDFQTMPELAKVQILLAPHDKTDILSLPELSKEQVILSVLTQQDNAIFYDIGKLETILGLHAISEQLTLYEKELLQIILAAQGATDTKTIAKLRLRLVPFAYTDRKE